VIETKEVFLVLLHPGLQIDATIKNFEGLARTWRGVESNFQDTPHPL
jgi:hypothetical protein